MDGDVSALFLSMAVLQTPSVTLGMFSDLPFPLLSVHSAVAVLSRAGIVSSNMNLIKVCLSFEVSAFHINNNHDSKGPETEE